MAAFSRADALRLIFVLATLVAILAFALLWVSDIVPVIRTAYLLATQSPDELARADVMLTWRNPVLERAPRAHLPPRSHAAKLPAPCPSQSRR